MILIKCDEMLIAVADQSFQQWVDEKQAAYSLASRPSPCSLWSLIPVPGSNPCLNGFFHSASGPILGRHFTLARQTFTTFLRRRWFPCSWQTWCTRWCRCSWPSAAPATRPSSCLQQPWHSPTTRKKSIKHEWKWEHKDSCLLCLFCFALSSFDVSRVC